MSKAADRPWGPPDDDGVRARYGSASRLTRVRRADDGKRSVATLLGKERSLVVDLLRSDSGTVKGKTLYGKAGNDRHVADDAAHYLLVQGWVELSERRRGSMWHIAAMRWLAADDLRDALKLPRRDAESSRRTEALASPPRDSRLTDLHASLRTLATRTLVRRATLVAKLDAWCADERNGSRNTFAQFALDDSHGMTAADWQWLTRHVDLDDLGIARHTPALWLRGPLCLHFGGGRQLELAAVPDMIALSPSTLAAIERIEGQPLGWLLVENRTSFEDTARKVGDRYAVVWMPGYVPDWWLGAMQRLVSLAPAQALIAADPDPAGIAIAIRAAAPFRSNWKPAAMSPAALAATGRGKPLNDSDRNLLATYERAAIHPVLAALADAIEQRQRKGEQEALDIASWLDAP